MANELSNLKPIPGETRERTRVGRGEGSGKGKTAGRGTKGAQSRSGWTSRPGFEGGQMPLHRRLSRFEAGTVVTAELLKETGVISRIGKDGVKILGQGELGVALHVRAAKLSRTAREKILAAGGTVEGPLPGDEA